MMRIAWIVVFKHMCSPMVRIAPWCVKIIKIIKIIIIIIIIIVVVVVVVTAHHLMVRCIWSVPLCYPHPIVDGGTKRG